MYVHFVYTRVWTDGIQKIRSHFHYKYHKLGVVVYALDLSTNEIVAEGLL